MEKPAVTAEFDTRPASKRRRTPELPEIVQIALADPQVCKVTGGNRVIGLQTPLQPPKSKTAPTTVLEAFRRSPHSLQMWEEEYDKLLQLGSEIPRVLLENAPKKTYRRRKHDLKTVVHWGQRKLLLSEIEFLSLHGAECTKVIYAGAAPGIHIPFLRSLFPHLSFVLVDPGEFKVRHRPEEGIDVRNVFFTSKLAEELSKSGEQSLFISDIRTADSKVQSAAEVDVAVSQDMQMQMDWVKILKPHMAMLKFRLPYASGTTSYFSGDLYLPVWGPITTTETRLITDGLKIRTYDNTVYEEQMFYFNTVTRAQLFDTVLVGKGLCEGYDSAAELRILQRYLNDVEGSQRQKLDEMLRVGFEDFGFCEVPPDLRTLAQLFFRISRECSERSRNLLSILPSETREKWFDAKLFDSNAQRYIDARSEEGRKLLSLRAQSSQDNSPDG